MELPNLGVRCSNSTCNQLDFLPLKCQCGNVFCIQHLQQHIETCIESKFLNDEELKRINEIYICSHQGCTARSVVELLCESCSNHFCIQHRHIECQRKTAKEIEAEKEKFYAPLRRFEEAKNEIDKNVQASLAKAKKRDTALKIQLMKLKSKAKGLKSIATDDRIYFNVHITSLTKTVPVFVSKLWSVGRIIDACALECNLTNNNNQRDAKKLRLFKKDDGKIVAKDLSVVLNTLLDNKEIFNGGELIIEYVVEDCQ